MQNSFTTIYINCVYDLSRLMSINMCRVHCEVIFKLDYSCCLFVDTSPVSEKLCGNNTPWKDNPCRQQDCAIGSHRGRTCTHDTCKRHDRPDGVLQACCKKAGNIQGHRCNGCQDAARHILDVEKADYLCRVPETTHRIT